jgi:hypothetical protein
MIRIAREKIGYIGQHIVEDVPTGRIEEVVHGRPIVPATGA